MCVKVRGVQAERDVKFKGCLIKLTLLAQRDCQIVVCIGVVVIKTYRNPMLGNCGIYVSRFN